MLNKLTVLFIIRVRKIKYVGINGTAVDRSVRNTGHFFRASFAKVDLLCMQISVKFSLRKTRSTFLALDYYQGTIFICNFEYLLTKWPMKYTCVDWQLIMLMSNEYSEIKIGIILFLRILIFNLSTSSVLVANRMLYHIWPRDSDWWTLATVTVRTSYTSRAHVHTNIIWKCLWLCASKNRVKTIHSILYRRRFVTK